MNTARVRERTEHDLLIMIDGIEFDVEALRELLGEVDAGNVTVNNDSTGKMLLKMEVLESLGNQRWYAEAKKGPNFDAFKQTLDDLLKKHHPGYN